MMTVVVVTSPRGGVSSNHVTGVAQVRLRSQDLGKHLHGVEDLLQLHALVEADVAAQAERVRAVGDAARRFAGDAEGESGARRDPQTPWGGHRTHQPRGGLKPH